MDDSVVVETGGSELAECCFAYWGELRGNNAD